MWVPWNLQRNPLVPSVPLEGSDTVQGLRTLERLRAAELLSVEGTYRNSRHDRDKIRSSRPRRSRYQRYKGPFIEFLGAEDLTREGKPWKEFGGQMTSKRNGTRFFDVPASLDLLSERIDVRTWLNESGCEYIPWYTHVHPCSVIIMDTYYAGKFGVLCG